MYLLIITLPLLLLSDRFQTYRRVTWWWAIPYARTFATSAKSQARYQLLIPFPLDWNFGTSLVKMQHRCFFTTVFCEAVTSFRLMTLTAMLQYERKGGLAFHTEAWVTQNRSSMVQSNNPTYGQVPRFPFQSTLNWPYQITQLRVRD